MSLVNSQLTLSQIHSEIRQIILHVMGDDVRSIPDDIPILDLGVSSLALVDGMRRVYDRFGVLVSIRYVIEGHITLGTLALYIEQELNSQQSPKKKSGITSEWKIEKQIPLAPSQQHIAFLSRYSNEASAAFNEALIVRIKGALHGPALHAAIEKIGNRYESLRTTVDPDANALDIGSGIPLELTVTPVSINQLQPRLTEIVSRPFENGKRLFRTELLRLSETDHVLVLVGHSLIIEPRALHFILNDLAVLYRIFSHDQQVESEPLTLQWKDYLALSGTSESNEAQQRSEKYWKKIFASESPHMELPCDHVRPSVKKYSGSRVTFRLDSTIAEHLRVLAVVESVQVESVLLAAFIVFIHRLSDLYDLVIGVESESLYLNNNMPAIANTHNMLPLRMDYDPARNFRDQIHHLSNTLADANEHRYISLSELIHLLQLPRDQSRSALFTVAFHSKQDKPVIFEGLETEFMVSPSSGARYDIELISDIQENDITLICDYSTELFEKETVSHWLKGISTLLESALQNAGVTCGMLPMMTESERELIINTWNATDFEYPQAKSVRDLIEEQAMASHDAVAVRFGELSLTYGQLIERSNQIASELQRFGVRRGDRVGILIHRSLDLIPSLLAIWRAGALYVPMDSGFPKQRITYMLADADVQAVITNRDLTDLLETSKDLLFVEELTSRSEADFESLRAADGAYIMYTSGSTGKPKGVVVSQRALVNCLLAQKEYLELTAHSFMLALTTISFDVSTNELFTPLLTGACVEIGEDGLVADGLQLVERLASQKYSHVQLTASTWNMVLAAGWQGEKDLCIISTGEAISRDLAERLVDKCANIWNFYGPTETTVYSTAYRIESAPDEPMRIGRPIPNTQIYILDKQLQPVPIGVVGDLYIGGDGVAVGYWQRKELTDQRFIPNPFNAGERMYFTGDLARYMANGEIICLGRMDDQVKIHGVRVELGEVETEIRTIEGVRDAVVVAWKDKNGDSQLVAHVILNEKDSVTAPSIRARLRERLPETMIPPYIIFAESFPRTANGKIQRSALPSPQALVPTSGKENFQPPSTPTEHTIAEIWAGILNIEARHIGRDSDFMDLGGHSLLLTLLVIEIRKSFQINFNLREFFSASTLRKFAALLELRRKDSINLHQTSSMRTSEWARQRMAFLQREAELPRYIAPGRGLTFQPAGKIKNVFLTGATGFLGVYTLTEILNTTDAHVYCLTRPKRGEDGKNRIENQIKRYQVWDQNDTWLSKWNNRLHIVEGDVTLPRLGMKDSDYETLARKIDAILHGAAHVNFIYPYEALRATNVLGIHEIIQFAFYARVKPVHHVSTAAIWPMGAQYTYFEKDPIDHVGRLNLGYDEAKWVGEKCFLNAEERGLPVARYRPGEVGGDSVTGQCVTDHFIIACFKGFLQCGAFPALDIEVDIAPVDYVAKAMVFLALNRNVLGRAFHLTNPSRRRLSEGLSHVRELGYQFEEIPFEELRDRLIASRDFAHNALFAYQAALEEMDDVSMQLPTYDTRETQHELAGSGISCPPADEKLFGTYLRFLQNVGFIPHPDKLLTHIQP